jgi:FkbM family methyltransferase
MSFISYAQNFEDVMLWRALKHVQKGFYIDVGAAWPDEHSVTKAFYLNGWRGINIEPNPKFHQLLKHQRPEDLNLKIAVGDHEGSVMMSIIDDTGLSTVSAAIAGVHKDAGWQLEAEEVTLTTLASICHQNLKPGQDIHFLKVDVEGLEEAALRGNDWSTYRPWIVLVEATLPMSQIESYEEWEPILIKARYAFAYADGLNRFYVANEHAELLDFFKYPPNFFDSFLLNSQQEAEAKARQAEAQARQAEAKAQQAEAKAQQAEAKAQQAEIKAQLAESSTQQHLRQLHRIYASRSWRFTAPLRWGLFQATRLYKEGGIARTKAFVKKILRKIDRHLLLRPRLRKSIIVFVKKFHFDKFLKNFYTEFNDSKLLSDNSDLDKSNVKLIFEELSPRSQQIFNDLKRSIDQRKGK